MRDRNTARGVFICLAVIVIALLLILLTPVKASAAYGITTARQDELHEAADVLRSLGYADDSEVIARIQAAWWEEDDALNIIAKVIKNEAPGIPPDEQWCPLWHQATVGQIIVNRVNDPRFQANTVREVVSAPKQYSLAYCSNFDGIEQHYYEMARLILDGEAAKLYEIPEDVIFHDNQAHGPIWKTSYINTGHFASTTYFCR